VTDAAEEDVDANVAGAEVAATEGVRNKRRRVGVGRLSRCCLHQRTPRKSRCIALDDDKEPHGSKYTGDVKAVEASGAGTEYGWFVGDSGTAATEGTTMVSVGLRRFSGLHGENS
jgi:hypothetical protein